MGYRHLSLFVIAFFACLESSSQSNKKLRDSLHNALIQHPLKDTQRVSLLNRLARVSRHSNPDTAMQLVEEGLVIARHLKSDRWTAQLLAAKSMVFSKKNQYDSAILTGRLAANLLKKEKLIAAYLTQLNIIAEVYSSKGEYSQAIDIFHEVILTARAEKDNNNYGSAYGNIGTIYQNFGLYKKAIENYKKALAVFQQTGDSILIGSALANLGLSYNGLSENQQAKENLEQSLTIFESLGRADVVPDIQSALALAYTRQGKIEPAIKLATAAQQSSEKAGNTFSDANAQIVLAAAYKAAGDSGQERIFFTKALVYAKQGLLLSSSIKEANLRSRALEELAQLYSRLGQFEAAYHAQRQFTSLHDSLAGENRRQEIAIKEAEFNNQNEQALLVAKHETDLTKQRNIRNLVIIGSILTLLAILVVIVFYRRYQQGRLLQQKTELKAEMVELENKALRAQMNPHFLFNCLNSIADYISKNKGTEARNYLIKFARLMRMILENSDQKEVALSDDIEALRLYMELESLRFETKPTCIIKVDEELNTENIFIPSLLLQPFVENCFKHGFRQSAAAGKILIQISKTATHLHCIIEDNGVGRKASEGVQKHTGYGLILTQRRIEQLPGNGLYKPSFTISDLQQGTRIDLLIPL